ncbi:hypothetical protein GQ651_13140 [Alphaproteobacteria bacterium GH1-50]|uniref:Uncharacterized protein n=1 Tax=Kangsaoukella pontilimi TaxID=2691042 RepID=A0A7C9MH66_9RHOB|nr:hypothetical protein [Kangsaoukella pontilimi]MXQ08796.1 hypothetical protein [Kangsaoukella pontilimi]
MPVIREIRFPLPQGYRYRFILKENEATAADRVLDGQLVEVGDNFIKLRTQTELGRVDKIVPMRNILYVEETYESGQGE